MAITQYGFTGPQAAYGTFSAKLPGEEAVAPTVSQLGGGGSGFGGFFLPPRQKYVMKRAGRRMAGALGPRKRIKVYIP